MHVTFFHRKSYMHIFSENISVIFFVNIIYEENKKLRVYLFSTAGVIWIILS
jgi:hypothetical protein